MATVSAGTRAHARATLLPAGLLLIFTGAIALYLASPVGPVGNLLQPGLPLVGAAAVVAGIRMYRPPFALLWWALATAQVVEAIGTALWRVEVADGTYPVPGGLFDVFWLSFYVFATAALAFILVRRGAGGLGLLEAGIAAFALALPAAIFLVEPYIAASDATLRTRVVQSAYAFADVVVLSLVLRTFVSHGRRSPAFLLVLASVVAYLASDFTWNWSTLIGSYAAGNWADVGWLLCAGLMGAGALHPSMRELGAAAARREPGMSWGIVLLVAVALFALPALKLAELLPDWDFDWAGAAVIGLGMTSLAVVRLVLAVREADASRAELARQNERLLELDRMKDDFVATVSHELRTPLTSIRGYLELVLDDGDALEPEQRRFLEVVDRNADRLLRLVGDLLFVAQVDTGSLKLELGDADLARLARECVQSAGPTAAARDVSLRLETDPVLPLHADAARIAQLLDNLVSNAVKFTPAGGSVTVTARARDGRAVVEVADTGVGIAADELGRLFQRFYRTRAASRGAIQGTGLGLVIARAIAEAHGGTIDVESAPGRGATFRVELPLREPAALREAA